MKKQKEFQFVSMLLKTISSATGASVLNISAKTFIRRRDKPEDLTLGELKKLMAYEATQGEASPELIRKLLREDLSL